MHKRAHSLYEECVHLHAIRWFMADITSHRKVIMLAQTTVDKLKRIP